MYRVELKLVCGSWLTLADGLDWDIAARTLRTYKATHPESEFRLMWPE